jgi:hypothetical protein
MDHSQGQYKKNRGMQDLKKFLADTAPLQFSEKGWKVKENISILDEVNRIGRKMPAMFPLNILIKLKKIREWANKTYGYVMFERG